MNKKLRIIILCILAISVIGMLSYIYFFDYKNNNNIENNPPEEQNNTNNNPIDNNPTDKPVNNNIKVTQVTLNITDASMHVGDSLNLVANVLPSTATNKTVTWDSSNKDVATVSNGKVTAIKAGNVTIYAKADDGQKMALCMIKVLEKTVTNIPVNSITLNKTTLSLYTGDSESLIANVLPNDATDKTVIWTSSNPGVAVVSGGKVTAVKAGTTTINATTKDGNKVATCKVTVTTKTIDVTGVKLSNTSLSLKVGESKTIRATIEPDGATNQNVDWTSSNPKVATVSNGKITAKGAGTATITVTTKDGGKSATCKVTVTANTTEEELTLTNTTLSMNVGESKTINTNNNQSVDWTSSNEKIATVSNGKVTSKRTGTVTITATNASGQKATCKVTIAGARIHFIDLDASADAILLEANGKFAMVDTGLYKTRSIVKKYLDNLGIKDLEFIILSHNHSDHAGAASYLSSKYNVKKLYMKHYSGNDLMSEEEQEKQIKSQNRYDEIVNTYGDRIVYVDTDNNFKETTSKSGYINLDNMKISFFNTYQRLYKLPSGTSERYVGYYTPSYYYNSSENVNSLVNLVEVNNHTALLTGDMNLFEAMKDIFKDRINGKFSKIDIFKIPHHAIYNCFGQKQYPGKLSYTLTASIGYYVVTRDIDGKYDYANGAYYFITPNKVIWNSSSYETPYNSCMYNIAKGDEAKAKEIMCNAYYASDSTNAVVFNLTTSKVTVSGGGQGKNVSSRCN